MFRACYSKRVETAYYSFVSSPLGRLTICCTEKGLLRLDLRGRRPADRRFDWVRAEEKTRPAASELAEYFAGQRQRFTIPLDLRGTPFQRQAWKALLAIPYGRTRSYGDIARQIGRRRAYRAVGQANHRNPMAIVVPCHRVVAADGGLGGYGGGLDRKQFLLDLEQRGRRQRL